MQKIWNDSLFHSGYIANQNIPQSNWLEIYLHEKNQDDSSVNSGDTEDLQKL